ncbi:hypothetical protein TRVL_04801 [Trypanosoma vivax]|nr:hypothetical protein TRVL_04801 [Trypanosoma vivax]
MLQSMCHWHFLCRLCSQSALVPAGMSGDSKRCARVHIVSVTLLKQIMLTMCLFLYQSLWLLANVQGWEEPASVAQTNGFQAATRSAADFFRTSGCRIFHHRYCNRRGNEDKKPLTDIKMTVAKKNPWVGTYFTGSLFVAFVFV